MKKGLMFGFAVTVLAASAVWGKVGGGDVTLNVEGAANVVYSHDIHVTKVGLKCTECHYKIYNTMEKHKKVTMTDMQKGQSCGACHNGQRAFTVKAGCNKCHVE